MFHKLHVHELGDQHIFLLDNLLLSIFDILGKALIAAGADHIVLGCTHFPHLQGHIAAMLPEVKLISPSREGALEIARSTEDRGDGKTVFL